MALSRRYIINAYGAISAQQVVGGPERLRKDGISD